MVENEAEVHLEGDCRVFMIRMQHGLMFADAWLRVADSTKVWAMLRWWAS